MYYNSKKNKASNNKQQEIEHEISKLQIQKSLLEERLGLIELKIEGYLIILKKEIADTAHLT